MNIITGKKCLSGFCGSSEVEGEARERRIRVEIRAWIREDWFRISRDIRTWPRIRRIWCNGQCDIWKTDSGEGIIFNSWEESGGGYVGSNNVLECDLLNLRESIWIILIIWMTTTVTGEPKCLMHVLHLDIWYNYVFDEATSPSCGLEIYAG